MIYRSRYLDRMLFSPLGYRQSTRGPHARARPRAQEQVQPRSEAVQPVGTAYPPTSYPQGYQQPLQSPHTSQQPQMGHLGERAAYLSSRELRLIVGRCEEMIKGGRAQIEDYEAFVICQQELSSRA